MELKTISPHTEISLAAEENLEAALLDKNNIYTKDILERFVERHKEAIERRDRAIRNYIVMIAISYFGIAGLNIKILGHSLDATFISGLIFFFIILSCMSCLVSIWRIHAEAIYSMFIDIVIVIRTKHRYDHSFIVDSYIKKDLYTRIFGFFSPKFEPDISTVRLGFVVRAISVLGYALSLLICITFFLGAPIYLALIVPEKTSVSYVCIPVVILMQIANFFALVMLHIPIYKVGDSIVAHHIPKDSNSDS